MPDTRPGSLTSDAPLTDLGPLAWVFEELRKSLEGATKAVRRFVREAEQSRHDELAAPDPAPLRMARQQLHQAVGALEMVGLGAPAQLLRAMEMAVRRIAQRPQLGTEEAAGQIERAGFALIEYLEAVLRNKPVQPVALFAQYSEVQALAGAERAHPADLWPLEHRSIDLPPPPDVEPWPADAPLRSQLDRMVLLLLKTANPAAAHRLAQICAGLSAAAGSNRAITFWRVAAAFFEALAMGRLPADTYVKRAVSRVLLQFVRAKSGGELSETLLHDLLFFCAQAGADIDGSPTAQLAAVRQAFGLADAQPLDYTQASLGRFDPAWLVQARKRLTAAKASWGQFTAGDINRARQAVDQFALMGDALIKLHPASTPLAQALVRAVGQAARTPAELRPELAMEVATTTLYLEAAFEDFDPAQHELQQRSHALAERLNRVAAGEPSQPLEVWMEQLYRRVSDRQTLGSVVGELKVALGEAEKSLDRFFRAPQDKTGLHVAVAQLAQMRGVLSVLGLEQAVQTVTRMRSQVEEILDTEVDEQRAREAGTFEHLGHNLSALGFLVDMLGYQPALAKTLFSYDEAIGELVPLIGRTAPAAALQQAPQGEARAISNDVQQVVEGAQSSADLVQLSEQLDALADRAALAERGTVAKVAREAAQALVRQDVDASAQALVELVQVTAEPTSALAPLGVVPAVVADDEPPMRDVFLHEAREVLGNARSALGHLRQAPGDLDHLVTLRRAFHTFKGSARMVGLGEFGEAGWAMEQALNAALAEQRPAADGLLDLSQDALGAFAQWVEDIAAQRDSGWQAQAFHASSQAWREHGRYQSLQTSRELAAHADQTPGPEVAAARLVAWIPDGMLEQRSELQPERLLDPVVGPQPAFAPVEAGLAHESGLESATVVSVPDVSEVVDEPLADIDLSSLASRSSHEQQAIAEAQLAQAILLPGDESPLGVAVAPPQTPGLPADLQSVFDEISLDLEAALPPVEAVADADASAAVPVETDSLPPIMEASLPDPGTPEPLAAPADHAATIEPQAAFLNVPAAAQALDDEQTRSIGPLRIGIKLYNVFLNEADAWSRRLNMVLSEWALERHEPVPDEAESLAHALAGASAAVGFRSLSDMARALEHAMGAVGRQQQAGQAADAGYARLFAQAAEDMRRLLHQFAAGFYKEPQAELLAALHTVAQEPQVPPAWQAASAPAVDQASDRAAEEDASAALPPGAVAATDLPASSPPAPAATLAVQNIDDDIDATDAIDPDLFPVFADEAQELLPLLGSALRQWVAQPDHAPARADVLRSLHTLKGSARLAGALHLGELAHRMETAAERLGAQGLQSADVEPLLAAFDAIASRLDGLRHADAAVHEGRLSAGPAPVIADAPPAGAAQPSAPVGEATPAAVLDGLLAAGQPEALATASGLGGLSLPQGPVPQPARAGAAVRVRPELLDRLVNQAGEVMISRSRMETEQVALRSSLRELTSNLDRLRQQLRDLELQAETQMQSRLAQARDADQSFDPLEFDRFTRVQELTRMMAESVSDVATVQRNLQRAVDSTEDGLAAQARQTRELQRDLLRTRMVEFEGIAERLYRVVRQASKETGKQVRLDISGGQIEMDRGVLDRMTPAFEHLLRNSVVHGIEAPDVRLARGKPAEGRIDIRLSQELNDVSVRFEDDGAGLDLQRLREKAQAQGLIEPDQALSDEDAAKLVFLPGLTTANEVSSLAGRGVGMDVVRNDVLALGGRIETHARPGQGAHFQLVLPLTTAVTQVVLMRAGELTVGVPSSLVDVVRRVSGDELAQAYAQGQMWVQGQALPFYWAGALLQSSALPQASQARTRSVVVCRSAAQRVALHVDEVLGNREVVVKNLGPQLSRLPGLTGMSVLPSGAVVLIYNPVALATVYGAQVPGWVAAQTQGRQALSAGNALADRPASSTAASGAPLVLVVDDSITVRRVTQRLLQREGYRVALAADGLQALERLAQERPVVVLSDIEMPRMDGFDLVRNIRNDPRLAHLPVVMITSRIAEKHRDLARELGVDHYLGKPYSEDELLALMARYAQEAAVV